MYFHKTNFFLNYLHSFDFLHHKIAKKIRVIFHYLEYFITIECPRNLLLFNQSIFFLEYFFLIIENPFMNQGFRRFLADAITIKRKGIHRVFLLFGKEIIEMVIESKTEVRKGV